MSFVFVSYSRVDQTFTTRLVKDLTKRGINIWFDQRNIKTGQRWDSTIQSALEGCTAFLIVLSPNSVKSENVLDELAFALEEGKPIIPVLYQDCSVPLRLRRVQHIDLRSDYKTNFGKIFTSLSQQQSITQSKKTEKFHLVTIDFKKHFRTKSYLTIGSSSRCDIVVDHPAVAPQHIKIYRRPAVDFKAKYIINVTTSSLTALNGKIIASPKISATFEQPSGGQNLKNGDIITIGSEVNLKIII